MNISVRNRLLYTLVPITLIIMLGVAYTIGSSIKNEFDELIDSQLSQSARVLLNLLSHEFSDEVEFREKSPAASLKSLPENTYDHLHEYEQAIAFQMWVSPSVLALRSQGAPSEPLAGDQDGYSYKTIDSRVWRVYALTKNNSSYRVMVAESVARSNELLERIIIKTLMPIIIALPVLTVLIWYCVGHAMKPLIRLADDVSRRDSSRLDTIEYADTPEEIQPLVGALNGLFVKLKLAFESERRFTANAAHELRTPLAAIKILAQVAEKSDVGASRQEALTQIISGVDRATHLVQQLLTLSRVDPEMGVIGNQTFLINEMAENVLRDIYPHAHKKQITLSFSDNNTSRLACGDQDMISILLRNLVDNAIRYTQPGGLVDVSVHSLEDDKVLLRVEDNGPGIPAKERQRVFERFYRCLGNGEEGCGLGLSIVKQIALIHHAEIVINDIKDSGLQVDVTFDSV